MTFEQLLQMGTRYLGELGIADGKVDAWLLMEFVWEINRSYYFLHRGDTIAEEKKLEYEKLLVRRGEHIPLQYLTNRAYFMGLSFYVNEHVLIPRMDTETLVEEALKHLPRNAEILDMCTGSGCILLALLQERADCQGTGIDISEEALAVAKGNARRLEIPGIFIKSNLYSNVTGKFDLIVSNPPYIPSSVVPTLMEEVREHEPILALDGKEDGLFYYRRIISQARDYLKPGSFIIFEIGYDQGEAVSEMLLQKDFDQIQIVVDLGGHNRVVMGRYKDTC